MPKKKKPILHYVSKSEFKVKLLPSKKSENYDPEDILFQGIAEHCRKFLKSYVPPEPPEFVEMTEEMKELLALRKKDAEDFKTEEGEAHIGFKKITIGEENLGKSIYNRMIEMGHVVEGDPGDEQPEIQIERKSIIEQMQEPLEQELLIRNKLQAKFNKIDVPNITFLGGFSFQLSKIILLIFDGLFVSNRNIKFG